MAYFRKYRSYILLIFFYLLIAFAYTFPLITQFFTHTLGVNEDSATHVWYLWWFRWSLIEGHSNPLWTDWIFWPQMINRTFDIHTWTNAIFSLPFQYLFGLPFASNLVFIFSLVFSALGAFFLSFYLTKNRYAALVTSVIYGFFPYLFAQAEDFHTNLITVWFFPWYLLTLLKLIETKKLKHAFLSGLVLGLQILNDWTMTSFLLLVAPIVGLYYLLINKALILNSKFLILVCLHYLTFLIVGLPLIIPAIITTLNGGSPDVPLWVQDYYATDIAWNLTPSPQNPYLSQFASFRHISTVESTLYIGWTGIILILAALVSSLRRFNPKQSLRMPRSSPTRLSAEHSLPSRSLQASSLRSALAKTLRNKVFLLPVILFVFYFVLSLGPDLHYFDQTRTQNPAFKPNFLMPFTYFHAVPLIGGIKEPARLAPFVMLPFALLVGLSFSSLTKNLNQITTLAFSAIVTATILFEFYPGVAKTTDLTIPEVYSVIAAERVGPFRIEGSDPSGAILDLPVGFSSGNQIFGIGPIGSLQYYQSFHHQKIFRGTVARIDNANIDYYRNIPLLHHLADPSTPLTVDDTDKAKVQKWFRDNKVQYIIIHQDLYKEKKLDNQKAQSLIETVLEAEKIYDSEEKVGYKVY